MSVKKRIDVIFRAVKVFNSRALDNGVRRERKITRTTERLTRRLVNSAAIAFEKTGLDIDNGDDWKTLALFFSAAVFGGRGRGHPKKWSRKRLQRLLIDFSNIRAKHPGFSEERCCEELIRESGKQYNKVDNGKTLRRVLQTAKRQQSLNRQIASLESHGVLSGVSKLPK